MQQRLQTLVTVAVLSLLAQATGASGRSLDDRLHHLRNGDQREWDDFPKRAESRRLVVTFDATANASEYTLGLRQQDVKQAWRITLNNRLLGRLVRDENDMLIYRPIPVGGLRDGKNTIVVELTGSRPSADIRVGELTLDDRPLKDVLGECTLGVQVVDKSDGRPVPCRITVVDRRGSLVTVGTPPDELLAVRPGIVYSASGSARLGMPPGRYTIHAGRGFEWSVESRDVELQAGRPASIRLAIRRVVETPASVACDTHVHTLTHSGHGDASITERMVTIAGEGIELPIATDHNTHVDYRPLARRLGLSRHFTPVIGNEVTTGIGHFNVFPIDADAPIPDYRQQDWKGIFSSIFATPGVRIVVFNHARDVHGGFRPFGPRHFNPLSGRNLDDWTLRANAIELINSGATQTDPLQLFHDWFALLNRGVTLTPVGSSDSHDVGRHFVGQGRTYVRCRDDNPGEIDVEAAMASLVRGDVLVSYGLLTRITVNSRHGPGDLVPPGDRLKVDLEVWGPGWATANVIGLYSNGRLIREARISRSRGRRPGLKWRGSWSIDTDGHDRHLVAIASGPGIHRAFWPTAKPYQPTRPSPGTQVIGSTGAVWIDADGDGRPTCARSYAQQLVRQHGNHLPALLDQLNNFDRAVIIQAADLLAEAGQPPLDPKLRTALQAAPRNVRQVFGKFAQAWRAGQIARTK